MPVEAMLLLLLPLLQLISCLADRTRWGLATELLDSHQVTSQGEHFIPILLIVTGVSQDYQSK